jgi:hypothetical protein
LTVIAASFNRADGFGPIQNNKLNGASNFQMLECDWQCVIMSPDILYSIGHGASITTLFD